MTELKPCPFCGGEAEYGLTVAGEEVYCTKCKAAVPRITTKEAAIELWNTRSDKALNRAAGNWAKADAELRALKEEQPIVRCEQCYWYEPTQMWCCNGEYGEHEAHLDGFCSWGEPREGSDK